MVDLLSEIRLLAARIPKQVDMIQTEQATKTSFVMPFIGALGYNVFDPTEVVPEFTADVGIKKGEKVDFAIMKDGQPILLFECKHRAANLDSEHASQLHRYFATTSAKFAVLTNGISYRFYSDLDEPNKMDAKPFFEISLLDTKNMMIDQLKMFSKSDYNVEKILIAASELKYTDEIRKCLAEEFANPSEEFVRFFAEKVYHGKRITPKVQKEFAEFTFRACKRYLIDRYHEIAEKGLAAAVETPRSTEYGKVGLEFTSDSTEGKDDRIVTTQDEIDGFNLVRAMLRDFVDPDRVVMRDTISYCGILLDDNNRKPICRLNFNTDAKSVSIMGASRSAEKIAIKDVQDLLNHVEKLKAAVLSYEGGAQLAASEKEK